MQHVLAGTNPPRHTSKRRAQKARRTCSGTRKTRMNGRYRAVLMAMSCWQGLSTT